MQTIHFISGLPRSGSTLLSAILRQNPGNHADMTSPVASLINGCLEQIGAGSEFYTFFDEARRKAICMALFNAYYQNTPQEVIFDTNRVWTARMHQLVELFDDFKVICLVRNPAWIMDSFEKIYRKNPFDYSRMFSPGNRTTVYSRCESLLNGIVGVALTALKEAFYGAYSEKLLLVDYELLTRFPEKAMKLIYEFTGVSCYPHDFDNVEYARDEFDYTLGVKGLHTVARKVAYKQRRSILPPDLFHKYNEMAFWKDTAGSAASVLIAREDKTITA